MAQINNVINNVMGFIVLIICTALFFKSGRKLLKNLIDKLLDYFKKLSIKLLKFSILKIWNLIKKISSELKTIKTVWLNYKERYMYIACTTVSLVLLVYKYGINYILFFAPFVYFILKAMTKEIREGIVKNRQNKISDKYKGISSMFDNKVKVISDKDGVYILNSFIPIQDIEKKQNNVEHFLNREIVNISRNNNNFRLITITTKTNVKKKSAKLSKVYPLHDYIKTIEVNKKLKLPVFLGVDRSGNFIIEDIMNLYHTFISGQVGGGKSTILNTMIQSAMYLCNNVSFILVDFKLVGFGIYYKFNNCYCVENYDDFKAKLSWLQDEMMRRYREFRDLGIEDIWQYHKLGKKMNYILLVIDEISNIKLSGNTKKKDDDINIEDTLINILNMSRGAGIIIIAATQNPYAVEIKSNARNKFVTNISARIAKRRVQEMTGVMGTENLQKGEFKMVSTKIKDLEFKSFLVKKDGANNLVYDELEKLYKNGGVNFDKKIN